MKRIFRRKEKDPPNKLLARSLPTGSPPTNCSGYPPALLPRDISEREQVHFYVPTQDGNDAIACSLYHCTPDGSAKAANKVNGVVFDLDSSIPIIIICHGYMSWRNQMLLAHLAGGLQKTGCYHTLRFDFVGNGHSTGPFSTANFDREFQNLQAVLAFVQDKLQCRVACVVGHSKAAAAVLRTAVEQDTHGGAKQRIPCFVNLSGRFLVPHQYDMSKRLSADKADELKREGKILLGRPPGLPGGREFTMTMSDVEKRNLLDSSMVKNIQHAYVLTIHGSLDCMVGVDNAYEYAKTIPKHELFIIEGADHNYNGLRHIKVMVNAVATFVDKRSKNG
jgi:alpha/beta superfamily hydrolase